MILDIIVLVILVLLGALVLEIIPYLDWRI
jgi:hypothetical protein